jgi:G3E family GTPase
MQKKIPVTVLCGYLGSGKTTLLNHVLNGNHGYKIAVIVNDMGEVNIDAELVRQGGFSQAEEELVQMQNGCICCTLRGDLLKEVDRLSKLGNIDYILIEASGISEPVPIAMTFVCYDDAIGIDLAEKLGWTPWLQSLTRIDSLWILAMEAK